MNQSLRKHLSVIIAVTVLGLISGFLILNAVHGAVGSMDNAMFSFLILFVPCAIMFICSFIIMFTANEIGRQMLIVVVVISIVAGLLSMFVTSAWQSDPEVVAALMANSPEDTVIVPSIRLPITCLRNIAAFFVVPTVGCIIGAWVGSRFHPMKSDGTGTKKKNKKKR